MSSPQTAAERDRRVIHIPFGRLFASPAKYVNFTLQAQSHLHYLTVGVVCDGQVTIIKNHQVDFRQL